MRIVREAARLRVDAEAFAGLVAVVGEEPGDRTGPVGAVAALAADPGVRSRVLPVLRAAAQVSVSVAGRGGVVVHQCWLGEGRGTALAHVSDGLYELLDLPPALLPRTVARLVGLGPRPRLSPVGVPVPEAAADLAAQDRGAREAAAHAVAATAPWPEWADALREGRWRAWRVATTWPEEGAVADLATAAVDTPAGLVEVTAEGELLPTHPTAVWAVLSRLVPAPVWDAPVGDRSVAEEEGGG